MCKCVWVYVCAYPCICTWEKSEMPSVIPALGRKIARGSEVRRHPWLHSKFRANLGCVRLSQKKKTKKNKRGKENKYRTTKSTRDASFRKMYNLSLVARKVITCATSSRDTFCKSKLMVGWGQFHQGGILGYFCLFSSPYNPHFLLQWCPLLSCYTTHVSSCHTHVSHSGFL